MTGTERTCVVCRGKAQKKDLLRFALGGAPRELKLDLQQRMPGRGVYCHEAGDCLTSKKLTSVLLSSLGRSTRAAQRGDTALKNQGSLPEILAAALKEGPAADERQRIEQLLETARPKKFRVRL